SRRSPCVCRPSTETREPPAFVFQGPCRSRAGDAAADFPAIPNRVGKRGEQPASLPRSCPLRLSIESPRGIAAQPDTSRIACDPVSRNQWPCVLCVHPCSSAPTPQEQRRGTGARIDRTRRVRDLPSKPFELPLPWRTLLTGIGRRFLVPTSANRQWCS